MLFYSVFCGCKWHERISDINILCVRRPSLGSIFRVDRIRQNVIQFFKLFFMRCILVIEIHPHFINKLLFWPCPTYDVHHAPARCMIEFWNAHKNIECNKKYIFSVALLCKQFLRLDICCYKTIPSDFWPANGSAKVSRDRFYTIWTGYTVFRFWFIERMEHLCVMVVFASDSIKYRSCNDLHKLHLVFSVLGYDGALKHHHAARCKNI